MDETVLRGFCQCGRPVIYDGTALHYYYEGNELIVEPPNKKHIPLVQYVLSAKQIDYVRVSQEFSEWWHEDKQEHLETQAEAIAEALVKNPFLVSKILKEGSEKK